MASSGLWANVTPFTLGSMFLPPGGVNIPLLAPVYFGHTLVLCGKYALVSITFSHRSDEAMSVWMRRKLVH